MRRAIASALALALLFPTLALAREGDGGLDSGLRELALGNYRYALRVLRPLAEKGVPEAELALGRMYANGQGVLQNYVEAHAWFNSAASGGMAQGRAERDALASRMTPAQIAEAQRVAGKRSASRSPGAKAPPSPPPRGPGPPAGNLVARIQGMLARLGYDPGPADGVAGTRTRDAIRSYQTHSGLSPDGRPSRALQDALAADLGLPRPSSPPASGAATRRHYPSRAPVAGAPAERPPAARPANGRDEPPRTASNAPLAGAIKELSRLLEEAVARRGIDARAEATFRDFIDRHSPSPAGPKQVEPRPVAVTPKPPAGVRIYDAFEDGDLTHAPRWVIRTGNFWVDRDHRLRTSVSGAAQTSRSDPQKDLPLAILGALLGKEGRRGGSPAAPGGQPSPATGGASAVAELPGQWGGPFELDTSIVAGGTKTSSGALELTLVSRRGPESDRTLRIEFGGAEATLSVLDGRGAATAQTGVSLAPGTPALPRLSLRQNRDGLLTVRVGDQVVLRPWEASPSREYTALRLTNSGGECGLDYVEILGQDRNGR